MLKNLISNKKSNYAVYRYEDLNVDDITSDSQIINKVFNILKEGKYKTYSKYSVTKRTGNNTYTEEQFFVFGSLNQPLTTSKMIECIKEYLLGTDTENNLHFMYPTLFGQDETVAGKQPSDKFTKHFMSDATNSI